MFDGRLEAPQFTRKQLLACVPGLSEEVFKQWMLRGVVALVDQGPVGTGNRRLYSASDIIQTAVFNEFARQGVLPSKAAFVWREVERRMVARRLSPLSEGAGCVAVFAIHPVTGELVSRTFFETSTEEAPSGLDGDDLPDLAVIFRVDRFIDRILARVGAITDGQAPAPPPNPSAGEDPDPLRAWTTDAAGRRVMVGLTAEETAEYERLAIRRPAKSRAESRAAGDRFLELHAKHEGARQARIKQGSSE